MKEQEHDQPEIQKPQNGDQTSTEPEEDEISRSIRILVKVLIAVEKEYQQRENNQAV